MRIMITGGGTGGHTSPALAVIEELQRRDPLLTLQWVGRRGAIEERICRAHSLPFRSVPMEGWPRTNKIRRGWVAAKLAYSVARAYLYIRRFRPNAVMGFGGYVSLPLMLAAQRAGVPTVFHEQNKRLGMANAMAASKARRIYLSFPDTIGAFPEERALVTGNPVRAGFITPPNRTEACAFFNLSPDVPVVLVTGGSQGAQSINAAAESALPAFGRDEAQFIWLTGKHRANELREAAERCDANVRTFSFTDDMPMAFAAADVIVSRSGASSTAEIAAIGRPAILIPYPHAADNHQDANARAFEERNAAVVLDDAACTGPALTEAIRALLSDRARRETMAAAATALAQPSAAITIVDDLLRLLFDAETHA